MNWEDAMRYALDYSRKYGVRLRVAGHRFHDPAGLLADCWIYRVERTK